MPKLYTLEEIAQKIHKSYNAAFFDTQNRTYPHPAGIDEQGNHLYEYETILEWYKNPPTDSIPIIGGYNK